MEKYEVLLSDKAKNGIKLLQKSGDKNAFKKLLKLLEELAEHPTYGTGKPKQLGGNRAGQWSRRITDKHRLVYTIEDNKLFVYVLSTAGHYDDK